MNSKTAPKFLAENRRARFDYDVLETFEAGLELSGQEVKSVRAGLMNIAGSYVLIRGGEAWLLNAQILPYQPKNAPADYEPGKTRRLLLNKKEIKTLSGKLEEKGFALVPLEAYSSHGLLKLKIALARSRKTQDKRQVIKKREVERSIRRNLA